MPLGDHLEDLRKSLIRAFIGVALGTIICLVFGKQILNIICQPLLFVQAINDLEPSLQVLAPTTAFLAFLKIGFLSGMVVSMPWVLHQIWGFVRSGLYAKEQRFVVMLAPASIGLFVVGVLFLYAVVLPVVLHFFINFNKSFGVPDLAPAGFQRLLLTTQDDSPLEAVDHEVLQVPLLDQDPDKLANGDTWVNVRNRRLMVKTPSGYLSTPLEPGANSPTMHSQFALDFYISFVLVLALAFGLAFQMPIVVFFLAWSGLVSTAQMIRGRRYVLLGVVAAAAMLTPPDVISQLLLAGPMYVLFEAGLIVARFAERKTSTESEAK